MSETATNDEPRGLPKGIFYEENRNRYRVRLYKHGVVFFRRYYPTLGEAIKGLLHARKIAREVYIQNPKSVREIQRREAAPTPATVTNLLMILSNGARGDLHE